MDAALRRLPLGSPATHSREGAHRRSVPGGVPHDGGRARAPVPSHGGGVCPRRPGAHRPARTLVERACPGAHPAASEATRDPTLDLRARLQRENAPHRTREIHGPKCQKIEGGYGLASRNL